MATTPAWLSNVGNIFRTAPAPQMAQPNPAVIPATGTSAPIADPVNPMDAHAALWQTGANPPSDPFAAPLFNTDAAKIAESASKMNIAGSIPPDLLTKAMSGSDPQAFMQVLNTVAQRAVTTSAQVSAATIEQATVRNNERIQTSLPGRIKQLQLDSLAADNPALNHPASQPLLHLVRTQIQAKHPELSAQAINSQAERYLTEHAAAIQLPAEQKAQAGTTGDTNWESWGGS